MIFLGSLFGSKQELFERLLAKGKVMVHLDARRACVRVPPFHRHENHLRLNFSLAFGLEDFVVDQRGVRASLLFGQERFLCDLPWEAIFAITSHVEPLGYLWPEDVPEELGNDNAPSVPTPLQLVATPEDEAETAHEPSPRAAMDGEASHKPEGVRARGEQQLELFATKNDAIKGEPKAIHPHTSSSVVGPQERANTNEPAKRAHPHLRLVK
ncbi:MAG: hypothetical protein RBU37_23350 [Myxococcota bacterium]|jgi:hypothetical protein|nr:hypothetical protein [Myxococcota bacterium]